MKKRQGKERSSLATVETGGESDSSEAFDLRFLINEDYGLCACVSPDYSSSTRRWRRSQTNGFVFRKERNSS